MRIAIIGLGLIGGSWGLALREWARTEEGRSAGIEVVGFDAKGAQRSQAEKQKVVDRTYPTPMEVVKDAQIVIVATPVVAVRETFEDIAPELMNGAIVTDVCSTKRDVMRWAKELLPTTVSFIGGHPMAGKTAGLEEADAKLFNDCTYCLIPGQNVREDAIEVVSRLVEVVGGRPHFIDADEHDSYVAAISHLPYLAAVSLVNLAASSEGIREISRLAGTGFTDTTRLASGSTQMWLDICRTNNDSLVGWIDRLQAQLSSLKGLLETAGLHDERGRSRPLEETDAEPLKAFLEKGREGREKIQDAKSKATQEYMGTPMPTRKDIGLDLTRMLVGNMFSRRDKNEGQDRRK